MKKKLKNLKKDSVTNEELIEILEWLLIGVRNEIKKLELRLKKLEKKND